MKPGYGERVAYHATPTKNNIFSMNYFNLVSYKLIGDLF